MTRSRLEHKYQKTRSINDYESFKKQKNYCNRLYKRESKIYYINLDPKEIIDNKKFWNTMKPFFTSKSLSKTKITFIESGKIINEDIEVAETLNNWFEESVSSLNISIPEKYMKEVSENMDPIESIVKKISAHPSILKIKEVINKSMFSFRTTNICEVEIEIQNLNTNKASPFNSISPKVLKENIEICGNVLHNIINHGIILNTFDNVMKLAEITPIHKCDEKINKKKYRPVSGLIAGSKIFERIMQKQMGEYLERFLSEYLCGYRKGFNVQSALILLLEKWRVALDRRGYGGGILMDLSKAFDTLNHEFLIAKLDAYGFDKNSPALIKIVFVQQVATDSYKRFC